jgi:type IV pilus assembly protein PilV
VAAGNLLPTDNAGTMDATATLANCTSTATTPQACSVAAIAYVDVSMWTKQYVKEFPNGIATGACTIKAGAPTTCDITLSWSEHYVAINGTAETGTTGSTVNMVLHVQP